MEKIKTSLLEIFKIFIVPTYFGIGPIHMKGPIIEITILFFLFSTSPIQTGTQICPDCLWTHTHCDIV